MTDWIDYIPELHSKILSKAYDDYKQLGEAYPNANKFFSALKDNISKNVPSNEDFKSPERMAEWSQAAALNAPMLGTVGKLPDTEFSLAHKIAQKNASLPVEQGGLGLPRNNTAMDRAKAMGFDTDAYHGTNYPGFEKFNTDGADYTKTEGTGAFFTDNKELAGSYTDIDYPGSTPAIYPVILKNEKPKKINFNGDNWSDHNGKSTDEYTRLARDSGKYESVIFKNVNDAGMGGYDIEGNVYAALKPKNIRSRFAAFDPMKKDSANILASTLAGTALAKYFIDDDEWEDYTP